MTVYALFSAPENLFLKLNLQGDRSQDEAEELSHLVRERMSTAIQLSVPVKVDIKSGPNWGAME